MPFTCTLLPSIIFLVRVGRLDECWLLTCLLTLLFTSYDTDPVKRKVSPDFYGYIPDDGIARLLLLACMTLNSALLLLVRAFRAAMLVLANKRYFVAYWAGDMALYLLQKVVRGDFQYLLPIDGSFGLIASLMARVLAKTITDFTGFIR